MVAFSKDIPQQPFLLVWIHRSSLTLICAIPQPPCKSTNPISPERPSTQAGDGTPTPYPSMRPREALFSLHLQKLFFFCRDLLFSISYLFYLTNIRIYVFDSQKEKKMGKRSPVLGVTCHMPALTRTGSGKARDTILDWEVKKMNPVTLALSAALSICRSKVQQPGVEAQYQT